MTEPTDRPSGAPAPGTAPDRPGLVIGLLVASAFVMILNETIMSVAIPHLVVDLDVTATTAQWLTSGFLLTLAVVIPTTGFLLERFSPRQIYLASMVLFSTGTLVAALAPGFPVLLAGRVVQAGGTALMIPLLMTTVMRLFAPDRRGSMMGTISIVIAVAPAIGPTISGAILNTLSWRWMFWLVLPLALIALAAGARFLRLTSETRVIPLDLLSVALSGIGFSGLVYGFSALGASAQGGSRVPPWVPVVVGVAGLAAFVARQIALQRRDRALLDLRPFTYRSFVVMVVLAALVFMSLLGAGAILLPIFLQDVVGASAFATGLAVLPGGLVLGLLGRPVGRLFDRVGARPLMIPGSIGMAASLWLFASLGPQTSLGVVVAIHMLLMGSLGLMLTPLLTEALAVLPESLYSHGSAIMTTLQQVAGAAGTALFVAVAAIAAQNPQGVPDAAGLRTAFGFAGTVALVAVVVAFMIRRRPADPATGTDRARTEEPVDTPAASQS